LGACSSSKKTSTSSTTTTPYGAGATTTTAGGSSSTADVTAIAIKGFKFSPSPAHVKVGTTVTVTNDDSTDHSLTANDASFDTTVFSSGSKTITLSKAGTFSIHCRIHNFMTGSIVVS
jgi:plastocyanin